MIIIITNYLSLIFDFLICFFTNIDFVWRLIYLFLSYLATFLKGKSLIKDETTNCIAHYMQQAITLIPRCNTILSLKLIMT